MKNNLKNILILVVFLIFAGTIVYADPTSAPLGDNIPAPITQLPVGQVKDGYLGVNKFVVGDYTHDKSNWAIFTSTGKLGLKYVADVNSIPSITENLEVDTGKVRLAEISTAGVAICADAKGTLTKCQTTTFSHSGNDSKPYETYTYKVPAGVTKITVELYGAGGAGYHLSASSFDRSPDDYNNCAATSGGTYNCSSGGSALLYDVNSTTNILAQAKGGHVALGAHTGGKGGTTSVSSSSKILSKSTQNGEDGGAGLNGAGSDTSQTFKCLTSGPTYTATIGGNGGLGGYGGKAGPTGGRTPGGNGGRGGFSLLDLDPSDRCDYFHSTYNGKGALSEGGLDGQFGSGGSGAGGIGGFSDRGGDLEITNSTPNDKDSLCKTGANCPSSDQGYAGGGGGGYTKTQLDVKGGEVYTIKLSHGGEMRTMTEDKGGVWCYYISKWSCHSGSYSGNGSGAYAKVTVN